MKKKVPEAERLPEMMRNASLPLEAAAAALAIDTIRKEARRQKPPAPQDTVPLTREVIEGLMYWAICGAKEE